MSEHNIDPALGGNEVQDLPLVDPSMHLHDFSTLGQHDQHQHQHQSVSLSANLPVTLDTGNDQQNAEAGPSTAAPAKRKNKSAPRTSQACLRCRKMKMRCEGSDKAPCRRCEKANVECQFDRRDNAVLKSKRGSSEETAWQSKIENRVTSMETLLNQVLLSLNGQGALPAPGSAVSANHTYDDGHQTLDFQTHLTGDHSTLQTMPSEYDVSLDDSTAIDYFDDSKQ